MRIKPSTSTILASAITTFALAAALTALSASAAYADTIASAQAKAAQVQSQVTALQTKAEIASEQYNAANSRYQSLTKQVSQSQRTIAKLDAQRGKLQASLDTRAAALYRQGPLGFLTVLLEARNFSDFDSAYQMITNENRRDALTVSQLKANKADAVVTKTRLVSQQTEAAVQQRSMADNERQVKTQLSASTQVLAQADASVRTLIAQKQAADAAAARAEAARVIAAQLAEQRRQRSIAQANNSSGSRSGSSGSSSGGSSRHSSGSGGSSSGGGNPPPGPNGAKAVYWAETKLGDPYEWAAAGPNRFDCSGLTMWAYKKVGISLPHYSRAQIDVGKRVSKSNLQPGDLVFFGSPIHHVGMYVGGGDFIEAPYTGANVRISKLSHRDDFAGACRP